MELARERYNNIMCFYLNRDIQIRKTGCVLQPSLPWFVTNPDGLICDHSVTDGNVFGILKIVCPKTRRNDDLDHILSDPAFFITEIEGELTLKKDHPDGHFTNIQLMMGLCGARYCDLAVFVFNGMLIVRTYIDIDFVTDLIPKLNKFYHQYLLPKVAIEYFKEKETNGIQC